MVSLVTVYCTNHSPPVQSPGFDPGFMVVSGMSDEQYTSDITWVPGHGGEWYE